MPVRRATPDDARAMSAVMIASITELCAADHRNDATEIAHWTRNKTPDGVRAMLAKPDLRLFVVDIDGEIAGVAGFEHDLIALNSVNPRHRFMGVSKALMASLEHAMRSEGRQTIKLWSSVTAHDFYLSCGWIDDGDAGRDDTLSGRLMHKKLADQTCT